MKTDISANRSATKYSRREQWLRVAWALIWPLFRFSPRICFAWRNFLLRLLGAKIGSQVHIYNSAQIYFPWNLQVGDWSAIGENARIYNLGVVTLGSRVTVSQYAHLCAGSHDYQSATMGLLKPPITIQDQAWVCADAFVGPGVTIGQGAVLGARAVAVSDVEPWTVVAGNPAQFIKKRNLKNSGHTSG